MTKCYDNGAHQPLFFCENHVHVKELIRDALHIFKIVPSVVQDSPKKSFFEILWGVLFGDRTGSVSGFSGCVSRAVNSAAPFGCAKSLPLSLDCARASAGLGCAEAF